MLRRHGAWQLNGAMIHGAVPTKMNSNRHFRGNADNFDDTGSPFLHPKNQEITGQINNLLILNDKNTIMIFGAEIA